MTDETLKSMTERVFISKPCDKRSPMVIAATITAAMKMASLSNIVKDSDVLNELVEAYGVSGNFGILNLIGMDETLIFKTIGFKMNSTYDEETIEQYVLNKDLYDTLFFAIKVRKMEKNNQTKTITMK